MYSYGNILEAYGKVGISKGKTIYITGNFGRLGPYEKPAKADILAAHLKALQHLVGKEGTLVVPTHTFSLCNTDKVFSITESVSETGPFTEFVRNQEGAVRQHHPFSSSTALGKKASWICADNGRHVYGVHSPFHRMIEDEALFISVSMEVERTVTLVHHAEFMMGVPYRYTKEFVHRCDLDGAVRQYEFYLHVLYRDADIHRDRNQKLFRIYRKNHPVRSCSLGRSAVYSLEMKPFYETATREMSKDIYLWLEQPPEIRPYRQ